MDSTGVDWSDFGATYDGRSTDTVLPCVICGDWRYFQHKHICAGDRATIEVNKAKTLKDLVRRIRVLKFPEHDATDPHSYESIFNDGIEAALDVLEPPRVRLNEEE